MKSIEHSHPLASSQRPSKTFRRIVFTTVLASLPMLHSCASIPDQDLSLPTEKTVFSAQQDDLASLPYQPTFEPDYNRLTPQPWVQPVTTAQQDGVDVFADRLEFPDTMSEVLTWEPGRLVVAAPGQGTGKNAMGFARRVVSVQAMPPKIVVITTLPSIEEILQGDMQLQLKPENGKDMDLSKADLDWVTENLYFNSDVPVEMPGEPLIDDVGDDANALGFFGSIGNVFKNVIPNVISNAAQAVASVAVNIYRAVTPATVSGSVSLDPTLSVGDKSKLFGPLYFSKTITSKSGNGVKISVKGQGNYDGQVNFKPGLQVGAKIALPGHDANSEFWINIDAYLYSKLDLEFELEAAIEAAFDAKGNPIQNTLDRASDQTQEILNAHRQALFGQKDVKPASSWKKTLWLSKPKIQYFQAGPVPVVVTETMQLDLECGFEAKASINTKMDFEQTTTYKFKVLYEKGPGRTTVSNPGFDNRKRFDLQVTGEGEIAASCGLIPRVNVFMYDSIGLNVGLRGSLVAKTKYESECKDNPNDFHPKGKLEFGLYGNVGVQAGARAQAPGSSFAGLKGQKLGYEFGPLEFWNKEFPLLTKKYEFAKGFGYCTPLCKNGKSDDAFETDLDCGNQCGACQVGKTCKANRDCANSVCNGGKCSNDRCGDLVMDAQETDVDCGGPVADCKNRCALGKSCTSGTDCASGYCAAKGAAKANTCVADHCADGVLDSDEGGIDCSGTTCAKCANGTAVKAASHCLSGLWNGVTCVGAICNDLQKGGDETDLDCGGPTCTARCGRGQGCNTAADCAAAAPYCDPMRRTCDKAPEPQQVTPLVSDIEVDPGLAAVMKLNRDAKASTVDAVNITASTGGMNLAVAVAYVNRTITITPMAPWPQGAQILITVGVAVTDLDGEAFFKMPYSWSFTTLDNSTQIARWNFDNNDTDASGNAHTATLASGATYTAMSHSGTGALNLNGLGAYAAPGVFDVGSTFTISGWVYLPAVVQSSINTIIANGTNGIAQNGFKIFINSINTSDLKLIFETGNGTVGCNLATPTNFVTTGKWQHFAVVADRGNATGILYWNGSPAASAGCVRNDFATNQAIRIGTFSNGQFPLRGFIDDLRIYNKLLTPQAIAKIATQ